MGFNSYYLLTVTFRNEWIFLVIFKFKKTCYAKLPIGRRADHTTFVVPAASSFFFMASSSLMSDTVDLHLYTTRFL